MDIKTSGYNIPDVTVSAAVTTGTKTEVGTAKEFYQIAKMVEQSGLMIVGVTVGGNYMHGSVLANYYNGDGNIGIDFGGVTNFGYSPSAIAGTLELGTGANADKCYVTMTVTPLGSQAKTSTRAKSE